MSLNIRPILSALLRNRTGAVLVAMQIALALAILVNATYVVKQRVDSINRPTGIDDKNLIGIETSGFTSRFNYESSVKEDLAWLRGLDGVVAATVTTAIPLSGSGSGAPLLKAPTHNTSDMVAAIMYEMDEQGLATLGARLIAGRNFRADEILPPLTTNDEDRPIAGVLVTEELARVFFPDGNAAGKTVYDPFGKPTTIIGVVANMEGPWPSSEDNRRIWWIPERPRMFGFRYLVRAQPGRRDTLIPIIEEHLAASNPDRVVRSVRSVEQYEAESFLNERITAIFLTVVTVALLAIAALGIFGLATFNVSTRTKQIGTRRAVGARKRDIVRYFLVENALITTTGIVIGCGLALAVGYWLSVLYRLPRLDLYYLVGGVLLLWLLGQLAAWQPARRGSAVSPSVATRTA